MGFIMQPVYRAAYALNPRYRTETFDNEVMDDLEYVLNRTLGEDAGADALTVFRGFYVTGRRVTDAAQKAAKRVQPHEWWQVYGDRLQPLGRVAMRLLAQIPSASACERNWSAYKFVHSEKRNRLGKKRARDLVNVFQNLRAVKRAKEGGMNFACEYSASEEEENEAEHDECSASDQE